MSSALQKPSKKTNDEFQIKANIFSHILAVVSSYSLFIIFYSASNEFLIIISPTYEIV